MLVRVGDSLGAVVCFYNHIYRHFTLGKIPDGERFITDGYICDWMNKKEYTLIQFADMIYHNH